MQFFWKEESEMQAVSLHFYVKNIQNKLHIITYIRHYTYLFLNSIESIKKCKENDI